MQTTKMWRWSSLFLVLVLLVSTLTAVSAQPTPAEEPVYVAANPQAAASQAPEAEAAAPAQDPPPPGFSVQAATDNAIDLIDPDLREVARAGGSELVKVSVLVSAGIDIGSYFERYVTVDGAEIDRVTGMIAADELLKLASADGILAVLNMEERPAPVPADPYGLMEEGESPTRIQRELEAGNIAPAALPRDLAVGQASTDQNGIDSFYTNDPNGVWATWDMGVTGDGSEGDPLKLAVVDTGVDFANPDLFGTQARVTDPDSAYFDNGLGIGWPIAFDDRSMSDYVLDNQDYRGNWGWYMNAWKVIADPDLGSTDPFSFTVMHPDYGVEVEYIIDSAIQAWNTNGGIYRFGWHPDDSLASALGETPGVLVTGEYWPVTDWGIFDTIYVDILADYTFDYFGGDAWATLGQETACLNLGWSTWPNCDLSGGMVYYISNGTDPVPASDWLYADYAAIHPPGMVVAFMLNDFTENGGDHGTLCAGTAVGQGVIEQMPYAGTYGDYYWPPEWYNPSLDGGISQGPARDTGLVAIGNYYAGGSTLNFYDFTALGYDGYPAGHPMDTNDQPHIYTNSYGSGAVENDGWNLASRYVTLINYGYLGQESGWTDGELPEGGMYSPLFVGSTGNSGFGYGTVTSPQPETAVMAGVSTVFGQFGLGDWALERNWVNWGHLGGFSDRGPTAMSTLGTHVLANGFFGSGNLPLNYLVGGDWAVDFWSGTSRSGPEAGGILALIYDAYYEEHGRYPSWAEARTLLMNGARTLYNDPFAQGAGMANALNAVEIVAGTRGVMAQNEDGNGFWVVGDYRGDEYPGFARGLFPGESDSETFDVYNFGDVSVDVEIEPVTMMMTDQRVWNFETLTLTAEGPSTRYYGRRLFGATTDITGTFNGEQPFYIAGTEDEELLMDADLMVVRLTYPFEQFENSPGDNWWFLYGYAWRDGYTVADGSWYTDTNGNTVLNSGEFQDEITRINYDYHGNVAEIRIREPWALMNGMVWENEPDMAPMDNILIMLRHLYYGGYDTTDLYVTVELYEEEYWNQLEVSDEIVTVPGGGAASFDVTATTTMDEAPGEYTGYIKLTYSDPYPYSEYIPVQKQVWFPIDIDPMLGGVDEDTLYDNGQMFGAKGPSSAGERAENGDWRFFYTDVDRDEVRAHHLTADYMLAHTTWERDAVTAEYGSDIDTLFYGPEMSDPLFLGYEDIFGPSGLSVIGGSLRVGSAPDWEFQTSTGENDDWTSVPIVADGLYGVAGHLVQWGGTQTELPFTITVGTVQATSNIYMAGLTCMSCTVPITFKTNHADLEGMGLEALGYGFNQPVHMVGQVAQSDYFFYPYTITDPYAYSLQINTSNPDPSIDIDLEVYYWTGSGYAFVGSSGRSDSNEQVLLSEPMAGDYLIAVYGYGVPGGVTDFYLDIEEISGLGGMTVTDLPTSIVVGETYTMYVHFEEWPEYGLWNGMVMLGPEGSPTAIQIPVWVNQGSADKTVPDLVQVGEPFEYFITLHEQEFHGRSIGAEVTWYLEDTLPDGVDLIGVEGAEISGTNTITWTNGTEAFGMHVITITAQADMAGTYTNTATIWTGENACEISAAMDAMYIQRLILILRDWH
jgi:hypothetical protein